MDFKVKNLVKDESFEKRIEITCAMNSAKCEFIEGKCCMFVVGSRLQPFEVVCA